VLTAAKRSYSCRQADAVCADRDCADPFLAAFCYARSLGDVVGTFAWNTTRHLECWYGIMGLGGVCHTLNPRLSDRDITYIAGGCRQLLAVPAPGSSVQLH
jgi:hypothetical protein